MYFNIRRVPVFAFLAVALLFTGAKTMSGQGLVAAPDTSAQSNGVTSGSNNEAISSGDHDLLIRSGDLLQISLFGSKDFDNEVRVNDRGEVSLPLVGAIRVAGLTADQAAESIAQSLIRGGYFNNPQVQVFEKEYSTQGISVLGEVQKPGIYPLLGERTLFDVISAAGGTTQKAGKEVTITHREHPTQPQTLVLSYGPKGPVVGNTPVYPGDTVVVSKAGIVYVVGDVHLPSGIVIENSNLTALQALAMAQGANPTASLNHAKIIRQTSDGRQEIPLPLKNILASKAPDPVLHPDDIMFVPNSTAKSVTRRSLDAALQTAVGVAIYRP